MKKVLLLLVLASFSFLKAQNTYTEKAGKWRLGFNMGAIWESSDVKPIPGLGGGFNIEKILNKRSNAFLGFSLGFRYLGGRTFGLNTGPTYDPANNKALNGTFNPAVKYDSLPGMFYANHKTYIQEGNLELKMNFPSLEKRTGIIFHVWGGVGISKYKTWIDALDKDGKMYDYSSLQGQSVTQSDLTHILDGKYETLAQGSGTNGTLAFIPSVGVGLGYKLGKYVAFVIEHKISFPGTNWLDGIEYPKNCPITGSKDFYNYTSASLVFTIYGKSNSSQSNTSTNNTVYTNSTTTNTTSASSNVTTNTTPPPPPVLHPPKVVITYPANNYTSPYDYTTINSTLQNVSSAQQISISQSGYAINHFTYNANNGTLNFQTFLGQGANNFLVTATNNDGTASANLNVNYNPIQTFTASTNYSIPTGTVITTNTVTSTNNSVPTPTTVTTNTVITTNTTHTVGTVHTATVAPTPTVATTSTVITTNTTHTVGTIHTATVAPTNTTVVVGDNVPTHTVNPINTNTVATTFTTSTTGTVVTTNPVIGQVTQVGLKPVVTFIDPSAYSTDVTSESYNVSATVKNVTNSSQINVTINGSSFAQFVYTASNNVVSFTAGLQSGYNTITISAANNIGSDSKSAILNYKPTGRPPKVTISNPASSPFTTLQSNFIVSGYVYNVSSSANITVTSNGMATTFNYNMGNHEISIPLNLTADNTIIGISAFNSYGSDAQSVELIYKKVVLVDTSSSVSHNGSVNGVGTSTVTNTGSNNGQLGGMHGNHIKPEITVMSPVVDPFYTNTGVVSVSANVSQIIDPDNVTVSYNGIQVSITYDVVSKHLNFSSPLKPGMNTFVINASNAYGSSSKSVNINYTPINVNTNSGSNNNTGSEPVFHQGGWNLGGGNNNSINNGTQSPPPKINQQPGQVNPVKPPVQSDPVPTPRTIKPVETAPQVKPPTETEQPQIRTRPR